MVIGRLIGNRYEILEQVGGGGMSLVYKAKDIYLNRTVAVKILREHLTSDEEFVARFRREAQAVASLSHSNIVNIYDVGQDKGIYYLIMEMVEGKNLKEILKERGALPVQEAVDIARQICDALEHAHEHQIIHRDVKPHNVILTENGTAKITDFGIARAVSTATVTHTGSIMGSVHYFSPEQAKGEIADEKSDIYSLGVVLYEMVTGKLPFEGESPISVAMKKIHSDAIPPRQINQGVGEAMQQVILKAMHKEPARRYDTIHHLKEDLISAFLYNRLEHGSLDTRVTEDTINMPRIPVKRTKQDDLSYPLKLWTGVMITLIIIGFIMGMYLSATVLARGEVVVPGIVDLPVDEARDVLGKLGLTLEVARTVNHPVIQKGRIVSQDPKTDQVVKKNSKIEVVISNGPTLVIVPNVLNSSLISAEVTLSNEGLVTGEISRVYNNLIPSGQVIHQDPAAGKEIVQGTAVNLIVSKGPEPVWIKMPALSGMTLSEARIILQNNNLVAGIIQPEESEKYPKDVVIRHDPGPDNEILQGSLVNLVVSSGPGPRGEQAVVKVTLTSSGTVRIVVEDERGRYTAYERYHYSGETIARTIDYFGKGFVEVYVNNKLTERKAVG